MFDLINPLIENYCEQHTSQEDELLKEVTRKTHLNTLSPRMLSGHLQGRILSLLSTLKNPKTVIEIGTFTGYSALCLAEGLSSKGKLHTIEVNEENAYIAKEFFAKSSYAEKIILHLGDAHQIIPTLSTPFDLVFIDADKKSYIDYLELVADKLQSGGLLITDNVLWSGKVIDETATDKETMLIRAFNEKLFFDNRFKTVMLPIRDGITVSIKK